MATSSAAVSAGYGIFVDVIEERLSLIREAGQTDLEKNSSTAGVRLGNKGATNIRRSQVWEGSAVRDTNGVVGHHSRVLRGDEGGDQGQHGQWWQSEVHGCACCAGY